MSAPKQFKVPFMFHRARLLPSLTLLVRQPSYVTNMGGGFFIVLERRIDGLDTEMDGKGLSRAADVLDAAASRLRVRPLSEFISVDPEQAAEFLRGESVDAGDIELTPLQQFSAQEGLATVRALLSHVQEQPMAFKNPDYVIQDLRECERILSVAAQQGVNWHFEVDF
jgi:hypothetical protein